MHQNFCCTPFPPFLRRLTPIHTKVAGSYSHLHQVISDWMQVLDVFNSFPQTVEAAASMGLIDSVKPKIDAVRNITHHTCGQAAAAAQQNSPGVSYQDDVAGRQTSDVAGRQTSEQSTASHLVLPASDIMLAGVERFQKGMIDVTTVNDDTSSTEACIYLPFHAYMIAMDVQKTRQPKDTASKPGVALICITGEGQLSSFLHASLSFAHALFVFWMAMHMNSRCRTC